MSQDFKISLNGEIDLKEQEEISKALEKAKIDEDVKILHKEMEEERDKAKLEKLQQRTQEASGAVGFWNTMVDTMNPIKLLEPIIKPLKIIIGRSGNLLSFIDAVIELQKTKDGIKVSLKIGASLIADRIFQLGSASSVSGAISAFLATSIAGLSAVGGVVVGIVILVLGVGVSWWVSKKAEELINSVGGSIIDYIREFDIPLTSQEIAQFNVAHCHKTMNTIRERQRKIFLNGLDITQKLYLNPYILPNKTIPKNFSSTWMSITLEQIKQIKQELEEKE